MMLALGFATPLLLIGLLAAAIPIILHLLASVRAQDMMFPTLRFLRLSMEKTARRRRVQHWLLLLLRAAMLALLALAVAEPISRATGGWLSGKRYAAVVILDNGYSMAVNNAAGSRFERAKAEAASLLSGDDRPSVAAVLTTSGGFNSPNLSAGMEELRTRVIRTRLGYGPAALAQRFASAAKMLEADSSPRKAIYLFSDMQRMSFEQIAALTDAAAGRDIHLLVVDASRGQVSNVGISDLQIAGPRVVDAVLEFTATLVNSSPTDKTVDVAFKVDGSPETPRVRKTLRPAGLEGSSANLRFHHRFARAGEVSGRVLLETADDLAADNVRHFSLDIGGRVRATVVRGEADTGGPMSASSMLCLALDPYGREDRPWPIRSGVVESPRFGQQDLDEADIAFFCEVPRLTAAQVQAVEQFTRNGGTSVFFVGPDVDAASYNEMLVQQIPAEGGLLPGRLEKAVGDVGPAAGSVALGAVDVEHPFFAGLYDSPADYLTVLVQRYYRISPSSNPGRCVVRLANGDPLVQVKSFGAGRVVLCTTTCGPAWSNLPITGLFLPMVARMSLAARRELNADPTYLAGAQVTIRPPLIGQDAAGAGEKLFVNVTPPQKAGTVAVVANLPLKPTDQGLSATFADTDEVGPYRWKVSREAAGQTPAGSFAVNPYGPETQIEPIRPADFARAMKARQFQRVYVAATLAEVNALASAQSTGRNWWDVLLAATILVFVFEAVIANRRKDELTTETQRR
jgi:hypothetical protein